MIRLNMKNEIMFLPTKHVKIISKIYKIQTGKKHNEYVSANRFACFNLLSLSL